MNSRTTLSFWKAFYGNTAKLALGPHPPNPPLPIIGEGGEDREPLLFWLSEKLWLLAEFVL